MGLLLSKKLEAVIVGEKFGQLRLRKLGRV